MANENEQKPGGSNNPPDNERTNDGAAPEGDASSPGLEGDTHTREERAANDNEARERERVASQAEQLQAVRRLGVQTQLEPEPDLPSQLRTLTRTRPSLSLPNIGSTLTRSGRKTATSNCRRDLIPGVQAVVDKVTAGQVPRRSFRYSGPG